MSGDWHNVELGDVLKYTQPTKFIVESTDYSDEFEVPVLTAGKSFILGHTDEKDGLYVDLPTIIFDDFTTSFHFVDFPFKVKSSAMKMLNLADGACDIKFMYYLMRTIQFAPDEHKRYWISKFSKFRVAVPPLAEQRRIAGILDEADRVRKKTQALIDKYDELAQSLFLDMFGDPVTNPKGWEKVPLNEFGNIITGNTPSRKEKSNYSENFIEWIKTDNITESNLYVTKAKEFLSEEGFKKGRVAIEGSLLVACIAGSIKSIGKANLIDRNVAFNQQINAIEPNKEVNNFFLYHLFKASPNYIQNHASSGMKRMLSKGSFGKILMILPNKSFQDEFAERVQAIETQKADANTCLGKAESCFQSLLQKAFKGELN